MTQPQTATQIPSALRAKRERMIVESTPAPAPTPENVVQMQPQPAAPAAPDAAPAPNPEAPAAEIDLTAFMVEPQSEAPAAAPAPAPALATAPADPDNPFAPRAPAPAEADPNAQFQADMLRLQGQVEAMQRMHANPAQAAPQTQQQADAQAAAERMLGINAEALTDEEREKYAGSIPVINKLINQALATTVDPVLGQINSRTVDPATMQQLTKSVTDTAQTGYRSTLAAAIPDLDSLAATPQFQEYLKQAIPYTGGAVTVQSMLSRAHQNKDVATLSRMMNEFRQTLSAPSAVPPATALHAPAAAPAAAPATPTGGTQKPKLKYSKRVEAGRDFQKGRISKEQLDKVDAIYTEAFREGRVDMSQ